MEAILPARIGAVGFLTAIPLFSRLLVLAGAPLVFAGVTADLAAQAAPATTSRSTRDGVYTDAQAVRGQMVFEERCVECHNIRLWGDWDGKSAGDVYEFINAFMPEPAPGTLNAQQVRDVIANFLKQAKLPAGASELPETLDGLKQIRMELPPAP